MEEKRFLPLGSVVVVEGGIKKMLIIARGAFANIKGEVKYFDYGACTYPEGVIGDAMLYFDHDKIQSVVCEGYRNEEEEQMQKNLIQNIEKIKEQIGDIAKE